MFKHYYRWIKYVFSVNINLILATCKSRIAKHLQTALILKISYNCSSSKIFSISWFCTKNLKKKNAKPLLALSFLFSLVSCINILHLAANNTLFAKKIVKITSSFRISLQVCFKCYQNRSLFQLILLSRLNLKIVLQD